MDRQHQVSIQVSPHVFLDRKGNALVSVDVVPLAVAKGRGWTPILIYGVCCSITKLKAIRVASGDEPISLMDTLNEIWRDDLWMKGVPDEVALCPELVSSPALCASLARIGVGVTLGNRKSYAINRRVIGSDWNSLWGGLEERSRSIAALNRNAKEWLGMRSMRGDGPRSMQSKERWEALVYRPVPATDSTHAIDWDYGPWAEIGFATAVEIGRGERLSKVPAKPVYIVEPSASQHAGAVGFELSHLVAAWPGQHAGLAREVGIPESRLRAYVRGRTEALDWRERSALFERLGLELDFEGYWDVSGPYLLMPATPRAADLAWSLASHGGDLAFGVEIVSDQNDHRHPDWHILLGRAWATNLFIFLIPRQADVLPERWRSKMINLQAGLHPFPSKEFDTLSSLLPRLLSSPDRSDVLRTLEQSWETILDAMEQPL